MRVCTTKMPATGGRLWRNWILAVGKPSWRPIWLPTRIEGGEYHYGAASLGVRPTLVANGRPVLEVHLFDLDRQIYGEHIHVEFLHKLRDEAKFPDLESLTKQIALDVEQAKHWLNTHHG